MKFENTKVFNFEGAFRGMRNPLNSWAKSDSDFSDTEHPKIGNNDMTLALRLINGGSEHRKFLRQILVSVDITAPMYWWSEFDTYRVGVTANSTSKMHKLATTPITIDCFETDDFSPIIFNKERENPFDDTINFQSIIEDYIAFLEDVRINYLETKDKKYWKELLRWLPVSWLQKRTVTLSYENLLSICKQRSNHKLNEWSGKDDSTKINFIAWVRTLPYAKELIFNEGE